MATPNDRFATGDYVDKYYNTARENQELKVVRNKQDAEMKVLRARLQRAHLSAAIDGMGESCGVAASAAAHALFSYICSSRRPFFLHEFNGAPIFNWHPFEHKQQPTNMSDDQAESLLHAVWIVAH
jgi:hypothetical protein